MAVRRIRNHGNWVWQPRVAYRGLRRAAFRATKDEARDAESDPLRELKATASQAEQAAAFLKRTEAIPRQDVELARQQ